MCNICVRFCSISGNAIGETDSWYALKNTLDLKLKELYLNGKKKTSDSTRESDRVACSDVSLIKLMCIQICFEMKKKTLRTLSALTRIAHPAISVNSAHPHLPSSVTTI